jgi:glycosyltransferase involved in cell wall biosynthesis
LTTVIWIDWYSYHLSRFRALVENEGLKGNVTGIELVGGCGVHAGLKFREDDRAGLPISSLLPEANWNETPKRVIAKAVWKKLDELNPSTVLIPGCYTVPGFAAALWAKVRGKRSVLMTETTRDDYRRVWWKEIPKGLLMRTMFDYAIAGGKPHIRYLCQLGFPADRIAKHYDVVDNAFYRTSTADARRTVGLRESLGLPTEYFVYVGRLSPEKNVDGLIDAFADFRNRGGSWSLVLVGDGPERQTLIERARALGILEYVVFTGLKQARETIPYYAFASCFVLPSVREPWGLVVNEAMASGLPVVVSSRCGCAEDLVRDGENGFLFDPATAGDLATQLWRVASQGPAGIRSFGQRSLEIIAGYSPQHWASEVGKIVQSTGSIRSKGSLRTRTIAS